MGNRNNAFEHTVGKGATGAQAAVKALVEGGIEVVFGIPGGHSFPIYAALAEEPRLRHVLGRHEQGLGFMADGYYRATGKIAAVSVTSGPAVANLACAMGEITTDTSAALVVASTPRAELIGRNRFALHDLNDTLDLMRPVCRYVDHAASPDEIPGKIAALLRKLRTGRPGAAFLQIPTDVMASPLTAAPQSASVPPAAALPEAALREAADLLRNARRPLIVAGTGTVISGAGPAVRTLAERLGAVVSTTTLARGVVPGSLPYVIFPDGPTSSQVNAVFERADVVLAVGTMFKQEDTCNWELTMGQQLIHIDIDADEFGRSYPASLSIQADARAACEALLNLCPAGDYPVDADWIAFAAQKMQGRLDDREQRQPTDMAFARAIRKAIPDDVMIFADRCNIGYWMSRCMPCERERTFHYPLGYGALGGALPQAIGAKIAAPERPVMAILGDGGAQFTLSELAVATQEAAPIILVVSNNHCYGAIRAGLTKNYNGLTFGTELTSPDYAGLAAAYGLAYRHFDDAEAFLKGLPEALADEKLILLEYENSIADPE